MQASDPVALGSARDCDLRRQPAASRAPRASPRSSEDAPRAPTDRQAHAEDRPLSVDVVYATRGRAATLAQAMEALDRQTHRPRQVIISCCAESDAGTAAYRSGVRVLIGPEGLARQRNNALRNLCAHTDIVVFFDDDFLPHPDWIGLVERRFRADARVACITGNVVADGIKGPGYSFAQAGELLAASEGRRCDPDRRAYSPYGCNMAFRCSAIQGLVFDERLVLYGWLEDRDFGGALARRGGELLRLGTALGVHLGVKTARVSGRRLGYSQVANPVYLRRKGTMTTGSLVWHLFKNISSNLARSAWPEPHVDRRGRVAGNARALAHLLVGRVQPEYAKSI